MILRVQEVIKRPLPDAMPAYARQTTVAVVDGLMKSPEVRDGQTHTHTDD
jgi:hypothetical protein